MDYLAKIIKLLTDGKIQQGDVYHLRIAHDDDCPMLKGKGHCTCDPDITVIKDEDFN